METIKLILIFGVVILLFIITFLYVHAERITERTRRTNEFLERANLVLTRRNEQITDDNENLKKQCVYLLEKLEKAKRDLESSELNVAKLIKTYVHDRDSKGRFIKKK